MEPRMSGGGDPCALVDDSNSMDDRTIMDTSEEFTSTETTQVPDD